MRSITIEHTRELDPVVRVDPCVVLPAGYRHVRQPLIDEFLACTFGFDIHQHAIAVWPWLLWLLTTPCRKNGVAWTTIGG